MLKQIEGSQAIATAVQMCRPEVISCYPITPQTHIVEALSAKVKAGELAPCEFINVESEFAALSVLIGSSAAGARSYTATASQGLLFMAEAVYNAAGMGLPIVMTIGNRAIGAPINIWNDHSDSMALRDAGWIQLYAESNQEAVDLHIQAFLLAEELGCPVMVCVDGFLLTHAFEQVDLPEQEQVDGFVPPFEPQQVLDPAEPVSIGSMVGPAAFFEVKYLAHEKQLRALEVIPRIQGEFCKAFGRSSGGLVTPYRTEDAETVVVGLGSVNGTLQDVVDELRDSGHKIGSIKITSFRPFPFEALREACGPAANVISLEKNLAPGLGGVMAGNIRHALEGRSVNVRTVIAGIGGRPITKRSVGEMLLAFSERGLDEPHFLDLDWDVIDRELERQHERRRSGPTAANVLSDIGRQRGAVT